jgi:multisubunit Na+/H+ antiporter MnhC subunit
MDSQTAFLFSVFGIGVVLTLVAGFYCILTTRNLIRALIGMEILTKAVTLLIIVCGYVGGRVGLAQALAITLIIIEVAVIVVAVGVVLCIHKRTDSIDVAEVRELKG